MKKSILFFLTTLVFIAGCDNEFEKTNPNSRVFDTFFTTAEELETGVNAGYSMLESTVLMGRTWWFVNDLRSDDMEATPNLLGPLRSVFEGSHATTNQHVQELYDGFYKTINFANSVIESEEGVRLEDEELAPPIVAQALFLRGFAYYELGVMYGGVPIYTETVRALSDAKGRSTEAEVFERAIEDLRAAQVNLPDTWDAANLGRATKSAAQGILAKALMHIGSYGEAKTELDKIVSSGLYTLTDEYDDNFVPTGEHNSESIWEIEHIDLGDVNWSPSGRGLGNKKSIRSQEYSPVGWRNVTPSTALLNSFEKVALGDAKDDPRFSKTVYVIGDLFNNDTETLTEDRLVVSSPQTLSTGETVEASWRKYCSMVYESPGSYSSTDNNLRMLRYADVLLLLAEAENELNNGPTAIALINQVRSRASVDMPALPTANIPTGNQTEIRAAVIHERRVELSGEQIRNKDILRWRRNGVLPSEPISYFESRHALFPIPSEEISNNPSLTPADQNPGY